MWQLLLETFFLSVQPLRDIREKLIFGVHKPPLQIPPPSQVKMYSVLLLKFC